MLAAPMLCALLDHTYFTGREYRDLFPGYCTALLFLVTCC